MLGSGIVGHFDRLYRLLFADQCIDQVVGRRILVVDD